MKQLFIIALFILSVSTRAQEPFQHLSFNNALTKAKNEGKFILLQYESTGCDQCNEVAAKGFDNPELQKKMTANFISVKIDANHADRSTIASAYNMRPSGFGTLFLDANGTLLHSYLQTTTRWQMYASQMDSAIAKAGEVLALSQLEKEYKAGNRGFGFIELLLLKRKALHLPTDALLDEYIDALPSDSLTATRTLSFIMEMAPLLQSKADKVIRANDALMNRTWYSLSPQTRSNINGTIINKSMDKAIAAKDEKYAGDVARFAQNIWTNNYAAGAKSYDLTMLRYYDGVKDTTNYFRKSIAYYERYFLSVSPDSIKRTDSINQRRLLASAPKDTVRDGGRMRITAQTSYAPIVQRFSSELNEGANNFYVRTSNPYLLSIAAEWSKKALEFYEAPEVYLTYAKLLYKQQQKGAALEEMDKGIALQKSRGFPTKRFDDVRQKMSNGERLSD